jgi:4-oxalocrotonate tautomerase
MPLVRIAMPRAKGSAHRKAISSGIQQALVETFGVPQDDLFQVITEHEPGSEIVRPASYLGMEYSDNLTLIQLTVSDIRTVDQKKALFARIMHNLSENPGLRPDDVFINLVEVRKDNWSFGRGIAQYA